MVPSTLLALATHILQTKPQSHKATEIHMLTPLTYELFFQSSSKKEKGNQEALERVVGERERKKRKREVEKEMTEIDNPLY